MLVNFRDIITYQGFQILAALLTSYTQKANRKYCVGNEDKFRCEVGERCKGVDEKGIEAKKACVLQFCKEPENENKFECLSLLCKESYQKMERLYCMKIVCSSHQDQKTCKNLTSCEENNPGMNSVGFVGMMAKLSFAKCVMESKFNQNLF